MKNPYYIVAPRWIKTSAGVKVLYKLCDLLNKSGETCFIYLRPYLNQQHASSPVDVAPFINQKIRDYHFKNKLTPIVIYPETINISKFNASFKVRYVLNYDNLLFENNLSDEYDYVLSYSQNISRQLQTTKPKSTIFLPVSDPVFFHPLKNIARAGGVFYAGKYKYHFSGKTYPITDEMLEITRDQPDSQTPEQIRDLFQKSEFFYCYEDSALALEAILCGCPVVFLPNEHFKETLGGRELKGLGYAWGDSAEQLAHAKSTVVAARDRYLQLLDEADKSVKKFIEETQALVKHVEYKIPFASGYMRDPSLFHSVLDYLRFLREFIEDNGLKKTIFTIFKRIRARRFKIY